MKKMCIRDRPYEMHSGCPDESLVFQEKRPEKDMVLQDDKASNIAGEYLSNLEKVECIYCLLYTSFSNFCSIILIHPSSITRFKAESHDAFKLVDECLI